MRAPRPRPGRLPVPRAAGSCLRPRRPQRHGCRARRRRARRPATSPPLMNVRRSTLLCSARSMPSMRALILGLGFALGLGLAASSAVAAQRGPTCTPATLNNSSLKGSSVTVSPLSGARDASPRTQISFLGAPASELSVLSVSGSRTGAHSGRLVAYSQGDGASFVPEEPFAEGERVTVRARLRGPGAPKSLLDEFAIATQDTLTTTPEAIHPGSAVQRFHSRPDLQPPALTVTAHAPGTAPGDDLRRPLLRSGPGGAHDPRRKRWPGVVQGRCPATPRRPTSACRNTSASPC